MILQNIAKAIREQNYYAVVLEFVIVIAGVVIGFQINAWNLDRQEAALEKGYLSRLVDEMAVVTNQLIDEQEDLDDYRDSAERFLAPLEADDKEAAQSDSRGLLTITRVGTPTVMPAMLNELLASGQLSVIRSSALREALSELALFEKELQSLGAQLNPQQSAIVHEINRYLSVSITDENLDLSMDFEAMRTDSEFRNRIAYAIYLNRVLSGYHTWAIERTRSIEALLAEVTASFDSQGDLP
jgi:hypothetical protein